jgi:nickel/cobalt transporter (NiCoT) family protein
MAPTVTRVHNAGLAGRLRAVWHDAPADLRRRLIGIYALLVAFNIVVWAVLFISSARYGLLLGLAPVAYGFGLRHAVDPDHIAAIDNTTRKLMQDGKRPVAVGLFFSLGHSSVVFALSLLIAFSAGFVHRNLPHMERAGSVIGTTVSGLFLLIIAIINLIVLADIVKTWRTVVKGGTYDEETLDSHLNNRGLLARLFRPLLKVVTHSWHMYLIGLLFGLGFDTASEVGILGMSATAGAGGMPVWFILVLPLLFVAGMSLVDTTDGIAMLGAYGWAYVRPVRKLYYNMNITLISVIIALFIGSIEVMQVVSNETGITTFPVGWAATIGLGNLGYCIIGIFLVSWAASVIIFKLRGIDQMDDKPLLTRTSTGIPSTGD